MTDKYRRKAKALLTAKFCKFLQQNISQRCKSNTYYAPRPINSDNHSHFKNAVNDKFQNSDPHEVIKEYAWDCDRHKKMSNA
jgi:hypothetical protein